MSGLVSIWAAAFPLVVKLLWRSLICDGGISIARDLDITQGSRRSNRGVNRKSLANVALRTATGKDSTNQQDLTLTQNNSKCLFEEGIL